MNKDILEGNKLIAEFMGFSGYQEPGHVNPYGEYHSSWDWLMPVVQKVFSITDFDYEEGGKYNRNPYFAQRLQDISYSVLSLNIEKVHAAVILFIQWYNKQTTPAKVDDKKGDY